MPVFQQIFANSGRPAILQTFAESVLYQSGSTGDSRTIQAVVIRDGIDEEECDRFEVHLVNHETLGVLSSQIKAAIDSIQFSKRVGETASFQTIVRIMSHDEGMIVVECR